MSTELALQTSEQEAQPPGLNLSDILFILFRHKWKIVFCAAAGLIAATVAYFLVPPLYESQAKLLVRYVVEKSAVDSMDAPQCGSNGAMPPNDQVEPSGTRISLL